MTLLNAYCALVIFAVGFAMHREGLFNAVLMSVNVLLAGILTFHCWEPLADLLDEKLQGGSFAGLEDALVMAGLFIGFLIALRWTTNGLSSSAVLFEPNLDRYGGAAMGLFAGYLLTGFLVCFMETLPWKSDFLGFTPRIAREATDEKVRRYFPPDHVWLALMHQAGTNSLSWKPANPEKTTYNDRYRTFDPDGTFELRYLRYRRYTEQDGKYAPPLIHQGELKTGK